MRHALIATALCAALALALVVAFPYRGHAQDLPEYTIKLSPADLNVIAAGLGELPKKIADPMVNKIVGQINAQTAEAKRKADAAKAEPPAQPEAK